MRNHVEMRWTRWVVAGAVMALVEGIGPNLPNADAAASIKLDDDKWISIGMGIRFSFDAIENLTGPPPASGATPGTQYSKDFDINHQRLYVNGQIHKYIQFTVNTECTCGRGPGTNASVGSNASLILLDGIGRFEFNEQINLWVGRTLVPNERLEISGPFNHATHDSFRTPFFPQDFSQNFPAGPGASANNGPAGNAGLYGRSDGAVFYGKIHPFGTHIMYVASVFTGLRGGPNDTGSLMYAGRLQWNLLNDEDNTGYYTKNTYFGTAGDILAIAGNVQHQKDGAGSLTAGRSDFTGVSVDLLYEKPLPNDMGVFTFNGEFKRFFANYGAAATSATDCFCIFNGHSWFALGLFLFPQEIGIGRFQPYVRYTSIEPQYSDPRSEWETGINYVISGFNARVAVWYRYGDIESKGKDSFATTVVGDKVDSFHVGVQLQF